MKICTVVTTDTRNELWQECIRSLRRSIAHNRTVWNHDLDVCVIAISPVTIDIDADEKEEFGEYPTRSIAKNEGCRMATRRGGEVVIWIDDDVLVPEETDWLTPFIQPMVENEDVVLTGWEGVLIREDFEDQWYTRLDQPFDYLDPPYALRLSFWDSIGGYDEDLQGHSCSNTDICLRAHAENKRIVRFPNPDMKHYRHRTVGRPWWPLSRTWSDMENWSKMREKYPSGWRERYGLYPIERFDPDPSIQYPIERGRFA